MIKKYAHILNFMEMQRFAIVGITAATTHFVAGMAYIHLITPSIVIANIMAYFTAFVVSIVGHMRFSFKVAFTWYRVVTFFIISVSAMGISTLTAYVTFSIVSSPSLALALGIALSAGYTFVLSKCVAFK